MDGVPVGECGRGCAVADGDEVPELRGLGHGGADGRAAGQHDHLLRTVVEQVVHHRRPLPGIALQQGRERDGYMFFEKSFEG